MTVMFEGRGAKPRPSFLRCKKNWPKSRCALYPRPKFLFKGAMIFRACTFSRRIIGPVRA
jgi:hypothetical protein